MSGRLKWYAARLAAMSPAEIAHRFSELAQKRRLARVRGGWSTFANNDAGFPDLGGMRALLARAADGTVDEVLTGARFLGHNPGLARLAGKSEADDLWHRDPVSGRQWPDARVSSFAVDVRSTSATPSSSRPFGDVKFVWEANRLQVFHPLAAIVARNGADGGRAQDICFAMLRSWMAANPPYTGVNWVSGIELALRLVSMTLLVASIPPGRLGGADAACAGSFVAAHAHMLEVLPSLHSSANNHRIAEGLGLLCAGMLLPSHARGQHWQTHGREILEAEALLQIYEDGVGAEQSPSYQAFSMELIAFGALLAQSVGEPFAPQTLARLRAGADFLAALQDAGGNVPAIGDDDEGRALLAPHVDEPRYVASVTACMGGLCGETVKGDGPGYFRERLFYQRHEAAHVTIADHLRTFPQGGYSVLRHKIREHDVHLVFDHGPLGYLSLAAHGHADALSIWLSIDGCPVFIDAGTWLYHSGEATRNALRSSPAHNTLSLPGQSQSEPSAAFSWSSMARARSVEPAPHAGAIWSMAGEHDGYRARAGVMHRREIIGSKTGFTIIDALHGRPGEQAVEIAFLCAPHIRADVCESIVVLRDARAAGAPSILRMTAPDRFCVTVEDAAVSMRFGELGHTARILLTGRIATAPARTVIEIGTDAA